MPGLPHGGGRLLLLPDPQAERPPNGAAGEHPVRGLRQALPHQAEAEGALPADARGGQGPAVPVPGLPPRVRRQPGAVGAQDDGAHQDQAVRVQVSE